MPSRHITLPLSCPKCGHGEAHLYVSSPSIITVECAACRHPWSVHAAALPQRARKELSQIGWVSHWRERRRP